LQKLQHNPRGPRVCVRTEIQLLRFLICSICKFIIYVSVVDRGK